MFNRAENVFIHLVCLVLVSALVDRTPEEVKFSLEKACVVPDVLPHAPRHIVKVKYFHGFIANLGNKLITNDIHILPNTMIWPTKNDTFYTIVFVGPDEPSANDACNGEWVYWLKINVNGTRYNETGDTIVDYASPNPLNGTSWHRYIYVIYEQPHDKLKVKMDPIIDSAQDARRANFSTAKFSKEHGLGDALAANFFIFEWRDDFFEWGDEGTLDDPHTPQYFKD